MNEPPSVLFDLATAWLVERKIVLPGVSVLARLIASVRDRATDLLWYKLAHRATPGQRQKLEDLLLVPLQPETRQCAHTIARFVPLL